MGCVCSSSADLTGDGLRIRLVKEIAQGGFSQVYLCEDIDSHEKYAVKRIAVNAPGEEKRIQFEAEQHRSLSSKTLNIVPLLGLIEKDSALHLVFPFYRRGTVADVLASRRKSNDYLPQSQVVKFALETCSAVGAVHSAGVVHRDLKTANLMIDDNGSALLMDFGSAIEFPVEISDAKMRQRLMDDCAENCSMPYRAPELFSCDIGTRIDERTDLWSLGCCLYALCYFVSPFDMAYERGDSVALAAQSPDKIKYLRDAPYDDQLVQIIQKILRVDPAERMPLANVVAALEAVRGTVTDGNVQIV